MFAKPAIKKAVVGSGAATKDQVGFMVARHLRLAEAPSYGLPVLHYEL